jgi:outer membrane receptor for ferrienterochelin and colicins
MTKILIIFLVIITFFNVNAQFNLKGKITHVDTQEAIIGATIQIVENKKVTSSNTSGLYSFENIAPDSYTLQIKYLGHKTITQKITISENTILDFNLENFDNTVDEVVVSGTMKEMNKLESAIPVEVYNPSFFKKNPTPNVFEALSMINGLQPQLNCNVCSTGDIHINGMEGAYTMILIDGMPIVSSLSTVYGLMGIPNSMIKRIEVIKGPSSTLYGSEAVAGIINIITVSPEKAPKLYADVLSSSLLDGNFDASTKFKIGKVSVLSGANYYNFNKIWDRNNDGFTDVTLQNRTSFFTKLSFERKNNRVANLALRYYYEDRWGGQNQWNPKFRGTDSIYGESIYTNRVEVIGNYQLPIDKEKITFQYSYNYHNQNSYYGNTPYFGVQNVAFAQLLWDKKIGLRHDLIAGLPFRYIFYDDNTPGTASSDSINPLNIPQITILPGLFVQDEIKITDKFTWLVGARYDYNNSHGSIFSPRMSIKYGFNRNNTLRLSAGNGFRVVNLFTEDHAALTGARKVIIAEKLRPEESWNVNLNYVKFFNHSFGYIGLDASVFYTYFTNKIIGDFDSDPQKIIYDNLKGYAISQGISANWDFSFTNGLKIMIGGTYMEVYQNENGVYSQQIHAPKISGTYQLSYTIQKLGLSVDYSGRLTGPMRLPIVPNDFRPEFSPWFDLANIQITKQLPFNLELYGGLKNIWDFMPQNPILRAFDPFDKLIGINNPNGYTFDASYNYAPLMPRRVFIGLRWKIL